MNAVPNKTLIVEVVLELGIDPAFVEKDWGENHFFSFDVEYPSLVDPSAALRPHLQIEFTESTLTLPALLRPVSSLIAELTKTNPEMPAVFHTN